MRIGIVTFIWPSTDPDSGIGNNYQRLTAALAARGHEVTVFHLNHRKGFWRKTHEYAEEQYDVLEIPCGVMPEGWSGWLPTCHFAALIKLRKYLRNQEVLECSSYRGFPWFYERYKAPYHPPMLIRMSTSEEQMASLNQQRRQSHYRQRLENSMIHFAKFLCTHTEAHRKTLIQHMGIEAEKLTVIPHGILMPAVPIEAELQQKFVLYAGRFESRKGTDTLLKAIPLVLERKPDCCFILAGGGEKAEIWRKEFLKQHDFADSRVSFLGRVLKDELEILYRECRFFVSPALYESFGMTYLEAMRHGKPVIGCRKSGGAEEVIGDAGLLIPPGDAEALADAIIMLWSDQNLHKSLSLKARARAEYYSMDKKAMRTEAYFEKMIKEDVISRGV